ncbi:MAG: UDP-2,4-diacetamido-2,4,6-trideoxy-beta-L-altropyranose hydrolase, partial [Burkholderiales bacterium]|nr:UDP-2,4-diacetamido-2,4,6-trideoxy-beta-L-altropyranose hydrolase [Burkholderiales bacterium]
EVMMRLGKPDWLVVDHYALDARWEKSVRPFFGKILVIDDLDDRPHEADLLLDQNLFLDMEQRYSEHAPAHCRLLLGPHYALLRPEFAEARSTLRARSGKLERLLVTFGSYDPMNLTLDALQGIEDADLHELKKVDVVVGSETPHLESITNYCKNRPGYQIHVQTSNMAALMAGADLAIGASGATTWERCCLGLPSIVFAVADNQLPIAAGCDKAGALVYLGRTPTAVRNPISSSLRQLSKNSEKLGEMSKIGISLVDGLGAQRVCNAMV